MAVKRDDKTKKWYFYGRHANGKQYKRRGFRTKKEAEKEELKFLIEYDKQKEKVEDITFKELSAEYLSWYKPRRKQSSYSKIKDLLDNNLNPHFGDKHIKDITVKNVMDFQTKMIDNFSGHHAKKICNTLSTVLNHAIKLGYLEKNVSRMAGSVDVEINKIINYWTLEEFKEFIKNVDDLKYYTLFMTLYYSGMRKGELLALTWADIDFEKNTIDVNKTTYNRVITTPKTPSSIRKIKMPKHVMSLLQKLKKSAAATAPVKLNYVVFGEFKDSIPATTLDRNYDKYVSQSSVKRIRLHDFRHSHASYLINLGTIAPVVAKRLGHGDVATTLNTYSHLYPSTEIDAVNKMEQDFKTAKIIKLVNNKT